MEHSYFKDRISAYYDQSLPPYEEEVVKEHLQSCEECQKLLKNFGKLDDLVQERSELKSDEYWEKAAQKIEQSIGIEDEKKVVEIKKKPSFGNIWKFTAAAASIAFLTFIALNEDEISQPADEMLEYSLPEDSVSGISKAIIKPETDLVISDETLIEKDQLRQKENVPIVKESLSAIDKDSDRQKRPEKFDKAITASKVMKNPGVVKSKRVVIDAEPENPDEQIETVQKQELPKKSASPKLKMTTKASSGAVEYYESKLAPDTKMDLTELRIKRDSLMEIVETMYSQEKADKREVIMDAITESETVLPDSIIQSIHSELIKLNYQIASNTDDRVEFEKSMQFIFRFENDQNPILKAKAENYLEKLNKLRK